jgi:hypothetical protein
MVGKLQCQGKRIGVVGEDLVRQLGIEACSIMMIVSAG